MKRTSHLKATLLSLVSLFALAQESQGAITITISGEPTATTATVTLSGSLTIPAFVGAAARPFVALPEVVGDIGQSRRLGTEPNMGQPTTSPFLTTSNSAATIGSGADTATMTITDTSNGDAVLVTSSIVNLRMDTDGSFGLLLPVSVSYPNTINAGDVLTLSGTFDLDLAALTFDNRFVSGTHTGAYDSQDILVVVTAIPEPSSILLSLLGLICLARRRR